MCLSRGSEWNRWDLHVHTASSYDYKYRGNDADDLLCKALLENEIRAVAITDHFKIDKDRIRNLRSKAKDIVFFPGVELRTDKGANNLHVILIFSEKSNLEELSADFEAIMLRDKAKSNTSNEDKTTTTTDGTKTYFVASKDDTTAKNPIPKAGSKRIIILLITALIITAVGSFLKYKKNEI